MSFRNENPHEKSIYQSILTHLARYPVRSYAPKSIPRSTIRVLLEAAIRAPSAKHDEPWAFTVIQDGKILKQLVNHAKTEEVSQLCNPKKGRQHSIESDSDSFHGAGTLIVICAKPSGHFTVADCWLAAENMMLTASAIGLGTCVIGSAAAMLSTAEMKKKLAIPDEYSAVAALVVGIPNGESSLEPCKPPLVLAWK